MLKPSTPTGQIDHAETSSTPALDQDKAPGQAPAEGTAADTSAAGHSLVVLPPAATEKITAFTAKRIAEALQPLVHDLARQVNDYRAEIDRTAGMDTVALAAKRGRLTAEGARLAAENQALAGQAARLRNEIAGLEQRLIVARDRPGLEEMGLFDYEHPAEASSTLATELEALRSDIRSSNKLGQAILATQNFTFNNSAAKGRTFVAQMSRIMLRAYNAEAENAVKTVKAGNLQAAQKRLSAAREQIARQGQMIDLRVSESYHHMRLRELELAARHLQAVAAEKELDRERRAELREQKRVEAELKAAREKLDKERAQYLNSIERLKADGKDDQAAALQADLDRIDAEIVQTENRAANVRAGYVYVISNLGSFGPDVVKIGMTRRLEPMDRVRELGDASVPFTFDVHALFFSDDAVSIEAMLHRHFAQRRINKVNPRREFFRVRPQDVLDALAEHRISILESTTTAAADDYRLSWPHGYPTA